jgi:hypothetical protein
MPDILHANQANRLLPCSSQNLRSRTAIAQRLRRRCAIYHQKNLLHIN